MRHVVTLAALLALALAACGSPSDQPAATSTPESPSPTATQKQATSTPPPTPTPDPTETPEPSATPTPTPYGVVTATAVPTEPTVTPSSQTPEPTPTPPGDPSVAIEKFDAPGTFQKGGSFHRMLRFAPAPESGSTAAVVINDHAATRDRFGVDAPPADASDEDLMEYKVEMAGMSGMRMFLSEDLWLSGFNRPYLESLGWPGRYLGFSPGDVQQTLITDFKDPQPSGAQEVIVGELSPAAARESLAACGECPEHETVTYADQEYFAWGEDLEQNLRQRLGPPAFDHVGRGGRIHLGEGHAFRTLTHAEMEELIDVAEGEATRLDEVHDFVLAALAMDEFGATAASISRQPFSVDDVIESLGGEERMKDTGDTRFRFDIALREYAAEAPAVPQPGAVATGLMADDEDRPGVIAALVFQDENTAQEAESAVEARLTGKLPPYLSPYDDGWGRELSAVEHGRTGRVVLLRIYPEEHSDRSLNRIPMTKSFFNGEWMFSDILSPLLATEAQEGS
ncbi:MAG: hypothetical protein ACOC5K_04535 [Chloroflexota bacterium]